MGSRHSFLQIPYGSRLSLIPFSFSPSGFHFEISEEVKFAQPPAMGKSVAQEREREDP